MTAAPQVRSWSATIHTPGGPPTVGDVLRVFDLGRREVARELSGSEGCSAGYDLLEIDRGAMDLVGDGDVLTVGATVESREGRRHLVEYVAAPVRPWGPTGAVVRARGWTIVPEST